MNTHWPIFNSICDTVCTLSGDTWYGKALIAAGAGITAFYTPITWLLIACFGLSIADMIYGIRVAVKQKKKVDSSKSWKGTLRKLWDEFAIMSLAHLLEFAVLGHDGVFYLTGGVTVIIGLTELWSIIENLNTIDPKGPWRVLGRFLKKKGEDYVGIELNMNDDDKHSTDNTVAVGSSKDSSNVNSSPVDGGISELGSDTPEEE